MASDELIQARKTIEQQKAEIDQLNPQVNVLAQQLVNAQSQAAQNEELLGHAKAQIEQLAAFQTKAEQALIRMQQQNAAAATAVQVSQAQCKKAIAQRDEALRRDTRCRRALSSIVKQSTDLLQEGIAFDAVSTAGDD